MLFPGSILLAISLLGCVPSVTRGEDWKQYEGKNVSFAYPAGWDLQVNGTGDVSVTGDLGQVQFDLLAISPPENEVQIVATLDRGVTQEWKIRGFTAKCEEWHPIAKEELVGIWEVNSQDEHLVVSITAAYANGYLRIVQATTSSKDQRRFTVLERKIAETTFWHIAAK